MTRDGSVATFWALSDPIRVDILEHIADHSAVTVGELANELPITRQAVARHLRTLEEVGLVTGEKQGRDRRYLVDRRPLDTAARWLEERAGKWDATLGRLATYVEGQSPKGSDA